MVIATHGYPNTRTRLRCFIGVLVMKGDVDTC